MSEPLRIALVAEGPTDRVVIEVVLAAILGQRPFILTQLQPEQSDAFGTRGGGWTGVYKWCRQNAEFGKGHLSDNQMLKNFHVLIVHLDADVAAKTYDSGNIEKRDVDLPLPCEVACPPPNATTDALRAVLLSWCNEQAPPAAMVICMPSKSTEAWVVAALFPNDPEVVRGASFECFNDPGARLGQQPIRQRIKKSKKDYQLKRVELTLAWPRLAGQNGLGQAALFDAELRTALMA